MRSVFETRAALRDGVLVAAATSAVAALCVHLEMNERLVDLTYPLERFQLDEAPLVLLFLACSLAWFAWRRMHEARHEIALRREAQVSLTAALTANRRLVVAGARAQEDERRRLARELHDELGQCINAIKLDAVSIRDRSDDAELRRDATAIVDLADRVQRTTRDIVRELRPPALDELGLVAALEHCVEGWRRRLPEVRFALDMPTAQLPELDEAVNIAMFRLVQEGLTNVVRHARPDSVNVALECRADARGRGREIVVRVINDGVRPARREAALGLGIAGMRERIEALGGRVHAASIASASFVLEARLPLRAA